MGDRKKITEEQRHAILWLLYVVLLLVGLFVWLVVVIPAGEDASLLVRVGAPFWWVAATIGTSHHWRRLQRVKREQEDGNDTH